MDRHGIDHDIPLTWNMSLPSHTFSSGVVIIFPDWIYGLLPFCGPGMRKDIWMRETAFIEEMCIFFHKNGLGTLTLSVPPESGIIPFDDLIISATNIPDVYMTIKTLMKEHSCNLNKSVLLGHGFGMLFMCELIRYGLKPAGYIIASGIYSDIESILTQKYFPFKEVNLSSLGFEQRPALDPESALIVKNMGKILQATRKGKEKIRIREQSQMMEYHIPKKLFAEESSPSSLSSVLDAPTLILHGSGDLDISVTNAFFLETKLRQKCNSVSRIVMLDRDHWFREMPQEYSDRVSERLSNECVHRPLDQRFLKNARIFISDVLKIRCTKYDTNNVPHVHDAVHASSPMQEMEKIV